MKYLILGLALTACDAGSDGDAGAQGSDARTADARPAADAQGGDARLPGADARPSVDGSPADAAAPPADAAVAQPCPENLAQRCFTPAGSLPMGQTEGVVFRAVRWAGGSRVLLQHRGADQTQADGWSLCDGAACAALPSLTLASGRWVVVHLDAAGTDTADEVFLGAGALPLGPTGEVALYRTQDEAQRGPATLERYVAWGADPGADSRAADAGASGRWTSGHVAVCTDAVGLVVVGASDRPTGYRAQPDAPAACAEGFR